MVDISKLHDVMSKLRDPRNGCPWDVAQDFKTVAPYTIEEAYEVADAIERADMDGLRDELGDLLFQVVFHAQMASEANLFDLDDVVTGITEKMLRRHPHVFGNESEISEGQVEGSWEQIKESERAGAADDSALAGVTKALPALKRAEKLGKRASRVGFDWEDRRGVRDKIREEIDELEQAVGNRDAGQMEEEFGDLLFAVVNLARHLKIDPENALTSANYKFERRFRDMEVEVKNTGKRLSDFNLESLDQYWRAAKKRVG